MSQIEVISDPAEIKKWVVEEIIQKTDEDELFYLFGEYFGRLKEKNKIQHTEKKDFDNSKLTVLDKDLMQMIRDMKKVPTIIKKLPEYAKIISFKKFIEMTYHKSVKIDIHFKRGMVHKTKEISSYYCYYDSKIKMLCMRGLLTGKPYKIEQFTDTKFRIHALDSIVSISIEDQS